VKKTKKQNSPVVPCQFQQGDVWFESAEIPSDAQPIKGGVFAEGEGHHIHRAATPAHVALYTKGGIQYARVAAELTVEHVTPGGRKGEHDPITLPIGDYQFGQIVEYDYLNEMARAVID